MNTLKNNLCIPATSRLHAATHLKQVFTEAKDAGFTMIVLQNKVYSIQAFFDCRQSDDYFINNYSLFTHITAEENDAKKFFNRDFECLYNIAMTMADSCIVNKPMEARFAKLTEEYKEVIEDFEKYTAANVTLERKHTHIQETFIDKEVEGELIAELSDLLFVLLHIAHMLNRTTAFKLLHMASTKMLGRINDPTYTAKN